MLHGVQPRHSDCPSQAAATSPTALPERSHLLQQEISRESVFWAPRQTLNLHFFSIYQVNMVLKQDRFFFFNFFLTQVCCTDWYVLHDQQGFLGKQSVRLWHLPIIYSLFPGCYLGPANRLQPNLTEVSKEPYWKSAAVYAVLIIRSYTHASWWQPADHHHASTIQFRHSSETTPAAGVFSPHQRRGARGRCNHWQRVDTVGLLGYKMQN